MAFHVFSRESAGANELPKAHGLPNLPNMTLYPIPMASLKQYLEQLFLKHRLTVSYWNQKAIHLV